MVLIAGLRNKSTEMTMLGSSKNNENPPTANYHQWRRRGYKSRFCSGKTEYDNEPDANPLLQVNYLNLFKDVAGISSSKSK